MKKCELFPVLDKHETQIKQAKSVANLVLFAGRHVECPKNDLNGSVSVVCDLLNEIDVNYQTISKGLTELFIVNNAVNGSND